MDAMTFTAGQLQARRQAGGTPHAVRGRSHAEDIRALLQTRGPLSAKQLEKELDLSHGRIGALMKWDRKIGRIVQHEGVYELVPNWRPRSPGLAQGEELICWHEVGEQLPDAELTVLARLRGGSEPVWLASWDGDVWRDTDGMVVEVIRWCDLPQGGAE